jgi:hypothetical protein
MRLRRWIKRVGAITGTVALGALLGFLVPTILAEYAPPAERSPGQSVAVNQSTELPIARDYINAFVVNDQARLKELGAREIDTVKANDLQSQVQSIGKPVLLGSVGGPGISIQAYAADVTLADGTKTVLSWRVWTTSGRAILILPPSPLGTQP